MLQNLTIPYIMKLLIKSFLASYQRCQNSQACSKGRGNALAKKLA